MNACSSAIAPVRAAGACTCYPKAIFWPGIACSRVFQLLTCGSCRLRRVRMGWRTGHRLRAPAARCRTSTDRRARRRCRAPTDLPVLRRYHDHHRGLRAPLSAPRAAPACGLIRDTCAVTRHDLAPTRSSAHPRLEANPLAPTLPKSRRRTVKIGPSAFERPLLRSKFRRSAIAHVRFWATSGLPTISTKLLSP